MSKLSADTPELGEDDIAKKTRKAELKTAEKAKKAAKKAQRKLDKLKRKDEEAQLKPDKQSDKIKPKKLSKAAANKHHSGFSNTMSLGAKLQAVARSSRGQLAAQLLEHGLYAGQEQVLFYLDELGPLALTELAEKLDIRAPTITKTVTRMEAQGFLSRAVSRDDARSVIIALTPDGRRVLKTCRQIVQNIEAEAFSILSKPDCENLEKILGLVFSHMKNA